jgi:hypothetical protein
MAPPGNERRPGVASEASSEKTGDSKLTRHDDRPSRDTLVRLLADRHCDRCGVAWHLGYVDGKAEGIAEGIAAEEWAAAARWHRVYVSTRQVLDLPTRAELARRRAVS